MRLISSKYVDRQKDTGIFKATEYVEGQHTFSGQLWDSNSQPICSRLYLPTRLYTIHIFQAQEVKTLSFQGKKIMFHKFSTPLYL